MFGFLRTFSLHCSFKENPNVPAMSCHKKNRPRQKYCAMTSSTDAEVGAILCMKTNNIDRKKVLLGGFV